MNPVHKEVSVVEQSFNAFIPAYFAHFFGFPQLNSCQSHTDIQYLRQTSGIQWAQRRWPSPPPPNIPPRRDFVQQFAYRYSKTPMEQRSNIPQIIRRCGVHSVESAQCALLREARARPRFKFV